jgi:ABC-type multidrug transport system fused ATPase/permease subunit
MIAQLRKIIALIDRQTWPWLVLLAAIIATAALFEVIGVASIFGVFQLLLDQQGAQRFVNYLPFSDVLGTRADLLVLLACCALFVLFVLKAGVSMLAVWLKWHIQWRLGVRLSARLFEAYLAAPLSFHLRTNSATLLRNTTASVSQVTQSCFVALADLASDGSLLIGLSLTLAVLQPWASLAALLAIGSAIALFWCVGQSHFVRTGTRAQEVAADMYRSATEPLVGIKAVKVSGRESHFATVFRQRIAEYGAINKRHMFALQIPRQLIEIAVIASMLIVVVVTVLQQRSPGEVIPTLALFAAAAYRVMPALVRISSTLQNFRFAAAPLDIIYADVKLTTGLADPAPRSIIPVVNEIVLDRISFSYEETSGSALHDVTLEIPAGAAVALVGASGAGKTTLVDVLLGLQPPSSGVLRINGVAYDSSTLPRGLFGYVPQETFLMDDTIRHNIALGIPDEEIDASRLAAALDAASLREFVAGLPQGVETVVGERGVRMSGGQRQRLGIARALYTDAAILVFDEATSALDGITEAEVTGAIERLHGAKTLVIVAHRLSTVRRCEKIFFLAAGRLVDSGPFDELVARNAAFRAMVDQLRFNDATDVAQADRKLAANGD